MGWGREERGRKEEKEARGGEGRSREERGTEEIKELGVSRLKSASRTLGMLLNK